MNCICGDPLCELVGLCHCGCGAVVSISNITRSEAGWKRGLPKRFLDGHNKRIRPVLEEAYPFKIKGNPCRLIPLSQGQFSIVDEDAYRRLMQWKWFAVWNAETRSFYAVRTVFKAGKWWTVKMHNEAMGVSRQDPREVDHIDPMRTLENCRSNLRYANHAQNSQNRRKRVDNTSGFKGVSYDSRCGMYKVEIMAFGKRYYLGKYKEAEVGAEIYREAALRLHGEFARFE
jgi:hypothetical protein